MADMQRYPPPMGRIYARNRIPISPELGSSTSILSFLTAWISIIFGTGILIYGCLNLRYVSGLVGDVPKGNQIYGQCVGKVVYTGSQSNSFLIYRVATFFLIAIAFAVSYFSTRGAMFSIHRWHKVLYIPATFSTAAVNVLLIYYIAQKEIDSQGTERVVAICAVPQTCIGTGIFYILTGFVLLLVQKSTKAYAAFSTLGDVIFGLDFYHNYIQDAGCSPNPRRNRQPLQPPAPRVVRYFSKSVTWWMYAAQIPLITLLLFGSIYAAVDFYHFKDTGQGYHDADATIILNADIGAGRPVPRIVGVFFLTLLSQMFIGFCGTVTTYLTKQLDWDWDWHWLHQESPYGGTLERRRLRTSSKTQAYSGASRYCCMQLPPKLDIPATVFLTVLHELVGLATALEAVNNNGYSTLYLRYNRLYLWPSLALAVVVVLSLDIIGYRTTITSRMPIDTPSVYHIAAMLQSETITNAAVAWGDLGPSATHGVWRAGLGTNAGLLTPGRLYQ